MVTLTGSEQVVPRRPAQFPAAGVLVWPERDELGRIVVWRGELGGARRLLRIGVAGETPEWVAAWLRSLADAVESIDR